VSTPVCPKCRNTMEEGYLLDRGDHNRKNAAEWIEGPPERGWFGLKTRGHETHRISTWRCTRCGYLESYAAEVKE